MEYTVPCITSQLIEGEVRDSPSVLRGSTRTLLSGPHGASGMPLVQKSFSRFRCSTTPCQNGHPPRNLWNLEVWPANFTRWSLSNSWTGLASAWYRVFFGRQVVWRSNCIPMLRRFFLCLRLGQLEVSLTDRRFLRIVTARQEPSLEETSVRTESKVHWKELCERAVTEQDPDKFLCHIQELIEILEKSETSQMRFVEAN